MAREEILNIFERVRPFKQTQGDSMVDFNQVETRLEGFNLNERLNLLLPANQTIRQEGSVLIFHTLGLSAHSLAVAGSDFIDTYRVRNSVYDEWLSIRFKSDLERERRCTLDDLLERLAIKRVDKRLLNRVLI